MYAEYMLNQSLKPAQNLIKFGWSFCILSGFSSVNTVEAQTYKLYILVHFEKSIQHCRNHAQKIRYTVEYPKCTVIWMI